MTDDNDHKLAILRRYDTIVKAYNTAAGHIGYWQKYQQEQVRLANDCEAAARVFGFELEPEYQIWQAARQNSSHRPLIPDSQAVIPTARQRTIKDIVLEAAQRAHPHPVRASRLRGQLEQQGIVVHEKTVGMTLYRLSREGSIRRVGKADWFFVPEAERDTASAQGQESPEGQSGLLLNAAE